VAFDFPALDRGHVESEAPNGTPKEQDQAEQDERVNGNKDEQVGELQYTRTQILMCN
jgi:hypothetical protein